MVTMVDPPEGWRYGFPKPLPDWIGSLEERFDWYRAQGYPQELIDKGMLEYVRYWKEKL